MYYFLYLNDFDGKAVYDKKVHYCIIYFFIFSKQHHGTRL